ncbi:MAG: parvulin peptidyl-prolyl isomerase [unclassified Hahellaceae]|nr:parvulin peptidyl-prolyl isomerase [Hahellaceae bacterium]|tara:strand:+ start:16654 stop:18594 length:1941 start_codon:yes stop_codon:yes gene_type:complete
MLQNIRDNAQGTVAKIIVGLIIVTFALFGVESIIGSISGEPEVAVVNGDPITDTEFQRAVELRTRQLYNQMGEGFNPSLIDENALRRSVLEDEITKRVRLQAAEDLGLTVSDQVINQFILTWPQAQVDGKFNQDRFLSVVSSIGLSPTAFREELRKDLMLNQLSNGLSQTAVVTQAELDNILRIDREQRSFAYARLDAAALSDDVTVTEEDVEEYYEANQSDYALPERVKLNYVRLDHDSVAAGIEPAEGELKSLYEEEKATFAASEERRVRHILLELNDDRDEKEALAAAAELVKQLRGGADFAALAAERSDDLGTKDEGGSLGLIAKGTLPELDETIFSLEEGAISDPVVSDYGVHVVKVDAIEKADVPTFDEAKPRLLDSLRKRQAESRLLEQSEKLADLSYSAGDLKGPAEELGLEVLQTPLIDRKGKVYPESGSSKQLDEFERRLVRNPTVRAQAFSDDVLKDGNNSELIEVDEENSVVLRVSDRQDASVQPLSEVSAAIRKKLTREKALKQLEARVEKELESFRAASSSDASTLPDIEGAEWTEVENSPRQNTQHADAARLAFTMQRPADGEGAAAMPVQTFTEGNAIFVIALKGVSHPEETLSAAERGTLKALLQNRIAQQELGLYFERLRETAEVEKP